MSETTYWSDCGHVDEMARLDIVSITYTAGRDSGFGRAIILNARRRKDGFARVHFCPVCGAPVRSMADEPVPSPAGES